MKVEVGDVRLIVGGRVDQSLRCGSGLVACPRIAEAVAKIKNAVSAGPSVLICG
jgi:hypothetical protein